MKTKITGLFTFLLSGVLLAQQGTMTVTVDNRAPIFWDMVTSCGTLGILNWSGILFCGTLMIPLGVWSLIECSKSTGRWPVASKLLLWNTVAVVFWGVSGLAQGAISSLNVGCGVGNELALSLSFTLYSLMSAFLIAQLGLLFLGISMLLRHKNSVSVIWASGTWVLNPPWA